MRYKFYREHKYVSSALNNLERLIAKADFRVAAEIEPITKEFAETMQMLMWHAKYENDSLHSLLKNKGSTVFKDIEHEHDHLDKAIQKLEGLLAAATNATEPEDQVECGYQFYLWYRKFVGDNLVHLHDEETIILPELQRLYNDEELRAVEFATYHQMSADDMIEMLKVLFPHMNPADHVVLLQDLKDAEPAKFAVAWQTIKKVLPSAEQAALVKQLGLAD